MNTVRLIRLETSHEHGTLGALIVNGKLFCWTLEPSDRLNAVGESSIPTGQYICTTYSSARYPSVYEVVNVPVRTRVLIHVGNTDDDTEGCILLGETLGKLKGRRAILNSGKTFERFREIIGQDNFHLTIVEVY